MKFNNMLPFRCLGLGIALFGMIPGVATDDLSQTYCSSQNTGSDYSAVFSIYQTNGLCHDQCVDNYAFAVVQYQNCWCSNYIPASTTNTGSCSQDCPGYPSEQCGNSNSGLFGYIKLDKAASGTAGASSASSTSAPQSSTQPSSTAAPSSTEEPETSYTSTPSPTTPSTTSTSTRPSSTPSSSHSSTATPLGAVTSVVMTTISGAVVTQTVTSTPVVAGGSHEDSMPVHRSDGLGAGAIAGIVIGVLAAVAAIAVAAFLLWRRKRTQENAENGTGGGKNLGRNVSVLSKAGLLARTRTSLGDDEGFHVTPATGQNSVRHSMMFAPGASDGVSPVSPLGSSHGSNSDRRMSRPMVYDQRLNPSALFANAEANGSRISMQDQQDYSRPLGVTNPDPRASFESRISRA